MDDKGFGTRSLTSPLFLSSLRFFFVHPSSPWNSLSSSLALPAPRQASEDGQQRGDCPFSHKVCMWLQLKGIEHTETFVNLKDKPDWFLKMAPSGRTPVLNIDGKIVEDSEAILDFLEKHTPAEPDLTSTDVALDVCPKLMSTFKEYYLNEVSVKGERSRARSAGEEVGKGTANGEGHDERSESGQRSKEMRMADYLKSAFSPHQLAFLFLSLSLSLSVYALQEANKEGRKKKAFDLVMVELHDHLDSVQHQFLCADHPTRADCALLPKLFHAITVLENVKKYKFPPDATKAEEYVRRGFKLKEFKNTAPPTDFVLQSWAQVHHEHCKEFHHQHHQHHLGKHH